MNEDEKPVVADYIELSDVDKVLHQRIRDMLRKHENIWNNRLGHINVAEHEIDLKNGANPFSSFPYRSRPTARKLESFEHKKLEAGVIEPAAYKWTTPIFIVRWTNEQLRFCSDYRKVNEVTLKDSYLLPHTDDCIDSLGQGKVFFTLDAYSGYWKMNIRQENRPKTEFVCALRYISVCTYAFPPY